MNISWDLYNGFEWLARMAEKPWKNVKSLIKFKNSGLSMAIEQLIENGTGVN